MIYLDHNATSPMSPEVRAAIEPWLGVPANPASAHRAGQRAAAAVEAARAHVAALVGGAAAGVVFTSGATEANHTYLRGVPGVRRVAVSAIEHPCVLAAVAARVAAGAERLLLACDADGRVVLRDDEVDLISLMGVNHETGVIQDLDAARGWARRVGARLHVDATQAAGKVALSLGDVDAVVLSSHKLGGPGGVGALVLRDGEPFPALLSGGSQERGRRAGTVNTAGVVGFGEACRSALAELATRQAKWEALGERLRVGLVALGGRIVGASAPRVPSTTLVVFAGLRGESVVQAMDLAGVCVSAGAACASGSLAPSPVLAAMRDPEPAGGVRFSLGPTTTSAEVDAALTALAGVLASARLAAAALDDWG